MVEKSRRELLEEAFDESERQDQAGDEEGGGGGDEEVTRASGASEGGEQDTQTDDKGESGEGGEGGPGKEGVGDEDPAKRPVRDAKAKEGKPQTPDEKERRAAADAQRTEAARAAARVNDKPPASWKPGEREDWAKIPPSARAAIARRETEIQRELSSTATIRKFSGELANIIQPHMQTLQHMQTTPLAAIDSLLRTASVMVNGTPEQKAGTLIEVMKAYGVDVRVLDKMLAGKPIPPELLGGKGGGTGDGPPPAWAKQIFDFMNKATTAQAQRNMQMEIDAQSEIAEAQHEMPFLGDLREDVADILEFAAKRGKVMTLAEAYQKAVELDPTVKQIVSQRAAAARNRNGGGNLAAKRAASRTVSGAPRGGGSGGVRGGNDKQSRREVIAQAMEDAE